MSTGPQCKVVITYSLLLLLLSGFETLLGGSQSLNLFLQRLDLRRVNAIVLNPS